MTVKPMGKLAQVTGSDVTIYAREHYDSWAESYESDLLRDHGYCAHEIAVTAFVVEQPDLEAAIIDVGCGTGLVGVELSRRGYSAIDGVDVSPKMLAKAKETGAYRTLITQDVEKASAIPNGAYDSVVCVGSFGLGHLGPEALSSLIAMVKLGGLVLIFMNAEPFGLQNYEGHIRVLEKSGAWSVVRIEDHNYMRALDRPGKLIVARRG